MEMNRGRIIPSSSSGHIHSIETLADVSPDKRPAEGDVLMFVDGTWTPVSLKQAIEAFLAP
jgi:hypothetical protein